MLTPPKHIKELENAGGASNANKAEMPITPKDCQEKHAGPFIGRRVARLPAPCQEKQAQKTPALPLSVPQLENVMAAAPELGAVTTLSKSLPLVGLPVVESSPSDLDSRVPMTPKVCDADPDFEVDYGPIDSVHEACASRTPPAPPPPPCRH